MSLEALLLAMAVGCTVAYLAYRRGYDKGKLDIENQDVAAVSPGHSNGILINMKTSDLETVAWLADWGLRFWIFDNYTRHHERLKKDKAEEFIKVLDAFERKIVPDLLLEPEDDKERRFNSYENRMKNMWEAYPDDTSPYR